MPSAASAPAPANRSSAACDPCRAGADRLARTPTRASRSRRDGRGEVGGRRPGTGRLPGTSEMFGTGAESQRSSGETGEGDEVGEGGRRGAFGERGGTRQLITPHGCGSGWAFGSHPWESGEPAGGGGPEDVGVAEA